MKPLLLSALCIVLAVSGANARAADKNSQDEVTAGKEIFARRCAECHAPGFGHPGTQQLGWKRGENRAILEQRHDLVAPYVIAVVRHGLIEMPAFRPTEISDSQLRELAAYLTASTAKKKP